MYGKESKGEKRVKKTKKRLLRIGAQQISIDLVYHKGEYTNEEN